MTTFVKFQLLNAADSMEVINLVERCGKSIADELIATADPETAQAAFAVKPEEKEWFERMIDLQQNIDEEYIKDLPVCEDDD